MDTSIASDGATQNTKGQRDHRRRGVGAVLRCAALFLFAFGVVPTAQANPCEVADNGTGTITLPPAGCDYLSPDEVHMIIDGLPPGTTLELEPIHKDFWCNEQSSSCSDPPPPGLCEGPGGTLGGNSDCSNSTIEFKITGTGALAAFNKTVSMPATMEIHTSPRNAGDAVQTFSAEMIRLEASLGGDPDFQSLTVRAGSANGLASPGQTTLTLQPNGNFRVESFFDIKYEIGFQGKAGSPLEGMGGTTTATLKMGAGINPCTVADNGNGTIDLPPVGCDYLSPDEVHEIIDGLPAGSSIELAAIHKDFICNRDAAGGAGPACSVALPGGGVTCESSDGAVECFDSTVEIQMKGVGGLAGFSHVVTVPTEVEVHSGPRTPNAAVQTFTTKIYRMKGALNAAAGDDVFSSLTIEAGESLVGPSNGQTTLKLNPDGTFGVSSIFNIGYRIEYQTLDSGPLGGVTGVSVGTIRMETGDPQQAVQAPSITGGWMLLLGVVLVGSSVWAIQRWRHTSEA